MGICSSCESTSVATAKLIHHDGKLQEFPCPVKVSHALQKNPSCFICNSDDMEFNDFISAINGDEDLLPGHIYFALPVSWLKHPIRVEEMASLAVKASLALVKSGGGGGGGGGVRYGCCQQGVEQVVTLGTREVKPSGVAAIGGEGDRERLVKKRRDRNNGGGCGGGSRGSRRRMFTTKLSAVFE